MLHLVLVKQGRVPCSLAAVESLRGPHLQAHGGWRTWTEHGCWEVSKLDITAAEKLGGSGLGAPGNPWGREGRSWQGCGLPLAPLSRRLEVRPQGL